MECLAEILPTVCPGLACPGCGLPLCGPRCRGGPLHTNECALLLRAGLAGQDFHTMNPAILGRYSGIFSLIVTEVYCPVWWR